MARLPRASPIVRRHACLAYLTRPPVGRTLNSTKKVLFYVFKLNRLTDYAFAVLTHLSEAPGGADSARGVSEATGLPLPTVSKLLKLLAAAQLVRAERGQHGGYRLARSAARIKVADVIAATDGRVALTDCSTAAPSCERIRTCRLRPNWLRINAAIRKALSDISLQDLSRPLPRIRPRIVLAPDEFGY
jgi:FeS assembly SUF system regulator